jgi:hypothetical protein
MFLPKNFYFLIVTAFISVSPIFALEKTYLLQEYFEDEIENMVIRETAKSNDKEYKLISLEYIKDSLNREKNNIYTFYDVLQYLALEGTAIVINENSISNFPNVRLGAVKILGQFKIVETRKTLIEVLRFDNDPLVLHEALKLLFFNWSDFYKNNDEMSVIINTIGNLTRLIE